MDDTVSGGGPDPGRCSRGAVLGQAFAKMMPDGKRRSAPAAGFDDLSVAILTGGESRRMGSDKALLELAGRPLVEHVIDAMRPLSGDLFLVGGDSEPYRRFGLPIHGDLHARRSSLVGIYSALAAARHDNCLVVSCDMPFADPALARLLLAAAPAHDAVVPVSPAGLEPLFALYRKSCLAAMAAAIQRGELKIIDVLEGLNVHWVAPPEMGELRDPSLSFFNVNTPEDLERAESLLPAAGLPLFGREDAGPAAEFLIGRYGLEPATETGGS